MSSVCTQSANELTHFGRAREWHGDRHEQRVFDRSSQGFWMFPSTGNE
jgi:hypothetical protein